MKKIIFTLFLMIAVALIASTSFAADWSRYESGRNNVRVDGYDSQPGYISFTDGNGTVLGYIWMSPDRGLVWASADGVDLDTTKLLNTHGTAVSSAFTGTITGRAFTP